jgi:hypothetical protein
MLLNAKVRGVGRFNFDAESLNGPALWAVDRGEVSLSMIGAG